MVSELGERRFRLRHISEDFRHAEARDIVMQTLARPFIIPLRLGPAVYECIHAADGSLAFDRYSDAVTALLTKWYVESGTYQRPLVSSEAFELNSDEDFPAPDRDYAATRSDAPARNGVSWAEATVRARTGGTGMARAAGLDVSVLACTPDRGTVPERCLARTARHRGSEGRHR
jgi:hypothetical protein